MNAEITITQQAKLLVVRSPFAMKPILQAIPGAQWNIPNKCWVYPATPAAAYNLLAALGLTVDPRGTVNHTPRPRTIPFNLQMQQLGRSAVIAAPEEQAAVDSAPDDWVQYDATTLDLARQHAVGRALLTMPMELLPKPAATRTRCFDHQARGLTLMTNTTACYLAWEMGTGKTKSVIDLISTQGLRRSLIVCPKSVIQNWPGQWRQHGANGVRVIPLNEGTMAKRAASISTWHGLDIPFVAVLNYEVVWQEPIASLLLRIGVDVGWDVVVCDEIHRIKDPTGRASKFMADLGMRAKRRVGLSGTPMPNSPLDLWAQMRFLDPGVFGTNYQRFKFRYGVPGGYQKKAIVAFRDLDKLNGHFYSVAHRVVKEDVLDLPKPMEIPPVELELLPKARAFYDQLVSDFEARVESGELVSVDNVLVELIRLQQVTSGFVKTDEGSIVTFENIKQEWLADFLSDLPAHEPVNVFCRFHHDLDVIEACAKAAGREYNELSGRRNDVGWKWAPKPGAVAGVQIKAGGLGVDFTASAYVVYLSNVFSLGDFMQSLARNDRQGQTRRVSYYHLTALRTIDQRIYGALSKKENIVQMVLQDIRDRKGIKQ